MLHKKYIIHLGFSGYPKGNASMQRARLTFKGLKNQGMHPLIINKISHHAPGVSGKTGKFDGIPYINTSYLSYRPVSFLKRNFNKLSGYFREFFFLLKHRRKIQYAILYSNYFAELPYYRLLSRLFGFKLVYQYVEFFSKVPGRDSFFTKLNDRLMDNYFYKFCDGVICISDFLVEHLKTKNARKPYIKLPANCDYDSFECIKAKDESEFMMYCGTIEYNEVINFILNIFEALKHKNVYKGNLLLILSGQHKVNWEQLNSRLDKSPFKKSVILKTNQLLSDIIPYYKAADLLLIPLRNSIQDIARFPHKVGEYTASKRPLVSTNVGELRSYFKDGESAILADEYSEEAYIETLSDKLVDNVSLNYIGQQGYSIGKKYFDYNKQSVKLKTFIEQL
jgi:glycosyltransferase involved in cell wall biosynthesis